MPTTEKRKKGGKSRSMTPEERASREALKFLLAEKKAREKDLAERKKLLDQLRGSLKHVGYSVDDFLRDKKKELELEER